MMSTPGRSAFSRAISSKPSISGILTSRTTRSGSNWRARVSASGDEWLPTTSCVAPRTRSTARTMPNLVVDDQDARRPLHGAARAYVDGAQGTVTRTRVPLRSSLWTSSVPPTSHRIERQMERPRPLPLVLVVKNGSKTRGRSSGAIPQPLSATVIAMRPGSRLNADGDHASLRAGLARVGQEVQEHLLEIALPARHRRQIVGGVDDQFDAAPLHAVLEDRQRRFQRRRHLAVVAPARAAARERQHAAEDPPAGLHRFLRPDRDPRGRPPGPSGRPADPPASAG